MSKPIVKAGPDQRQYTKHFVALVQAWVDSKEAEGTSFKSKEIIVTSGPWRDAAVRAELDSETGELHLDFYAALRAGFGFLPDEDVKAIKDEWL